MPFSITQRPITLVADDKAVNAGGALPELTFTVTNLVTDETAAVALSVNPVLSCPTFNADVPNDYTIEITGGTATANYTVTNRVNGTLTVNPLTTIPPGSNNGGNQGGTTPPTTPSTPETPTTPTTPETIPASGGTDTTVNVPVTINNDTGAVTVQLDAETKNTLIEKAVTAAEGTDTTPAVTLDLSAVDGATSAELNVYAAQAFSEAEVAVTVVLPSGEITLAPETLAILAASHDVGATPITVEASIVPMSDLRGMQAAQVRGFETVISLDVFVGGEKVNVPLTVSLPYTLKPNEKPAAVRVWHMDAAGNLTCMNGVFDETSGMITFTIQHQSYFIVGYDPVALWVNIFSDLSSDAWYYEAIAFMNLQGLMVGYGNGMVGVNDTLTRAQFATLLWNLEGQPAPAGTVSFDDVREGAWYYNAVIWAAEQGVVAGVGGGRFEPGTPITRQQAAQMLWNYAVNFKGYDIPENRPMPEYTDKDQIDAWAESAAKALAEAGVLRDEDEFRPGDDATRGEAADMFRSFLRFVAEG